MPSPHSAASSDPAPAHHKINYVEFASSNPQQSCDFFLALFGGFEMSARYTRQGHIARLQIISTPVSKCPKDKSKTSATAFFESSSQEVHEATVVCFWL